jgi:hypothetical protein
VLDKSFSMHENHQLEISKRAIEVVVQQFAGAWDRIGASPCLHIILSTCHDSEASFSRSFKPHYSAV